MGNLNKAISCFQALGIKPNIKDFQSKLVMQKTVYLLQQMGVKMDFRYGLYVRGAYSPELTEALYQHVAQVEELKGGEKLSAKEMEAIKEFNDEMDGLDPAVLEIAATYAYFFKEKGFSAHDATIKTKEAKPFFTEMQFVKGINRGKALVFKPTKEELAELKKEMAPWEAASIESWKRFK